MPAAGRRTCVGCVDCVGDGENDCITCANPADGLDVAEEDRTWLLISNLDDRSGTCVKECPENHFIHAASGMSLSEKEEPSEALPSIPPFLFSPTALVEWCARWWWWWWWWWFGPSDPHGVSVVLLLLQLFVFPLPKRRQVNAVHAATAPPASLSRRRAQSPR